MPRRVRRLIEAAEFGKPRGNHELRRDEIVALDQVRLLLVQENPEVGFPVLHDETGGPADQNRHLRVPVHSR